MDRSLLLNGEERDRLKALHEIRKRHITQRQAAEQLKLSTRWVKKLVKRLRENGDQAVKHGFERAKFESQDQPRTGEKKAIDLLRRHHRDYGPTQAPRYSPVNTDCG